jgi:hypothetical protein
MQIAAFWRLSQSLCRGIPLPQKFRSAIADQRGMAMIEFALVFMVFATLLFGIIEVGRAIWTLNEMHYTVQRAARCRAVNSACNNLANMRSWIDSNLGPGVPSSSYDFVTCDSGGTSNGTKVRGQYTLTLSIPFFAMAPIFQANETSDCFPMNVVAP